MLLNTQRQERRRRRANRKCRDLSGATVAYAFQPGATKCHVDLSSSIFKIVYNLQMQHIYTRFSRIRVNRVLNTFFAPFNMFSVLRQIFDMQVRKIKRYERVRCIRNFSFFVLGIFLCILRQERWSAHRKCRDLNSLIVAYAFQPGTFKFHSDESSSSTNANIFPLSRIINISTFHANISVPRCPHQVVKIISGLLN